ncbi:hypothetical protein [Phenylobacterium sp.]|uniref:hypothetical protein n=1 Tax=Phenylobacterium sp. TaxID=1871053 RepID=UPI00301BEDB3
MPSSFARSPTTPSLDRPCALSLLDALMVSATGRSMPGTALGQVLPSHGAGGGVRVLTMLSGALSWGDGDMDAAAERAVGPGSIIVVLAQGGEHWAAARKDDVLLQGVLVGDGALAPEAAAP